MIQQVFQFMVDKRLILYVMGAVTAAGVFSKLLVWAAYRKLCRQSCHMAAAEHPLLKNIRLRFEEAEGFSSGVYNVDAFVDKYVYEYKIGGIYLFTWERLCGQTCAIVVLISLFASLAGYFLKSGQGSVLSTLMAGGVSAVLLISMEFLLREDDRHLYLVTEIKDYLENHLKRRLEAERARMDMHEERQFKLHSVQGNAQTARKTGKDRKKVKDQAESLRQSSAVDEKAIDDILKEYIF